MHLYNIRVVFLTLFTIFLHIVPTVELASFLLFQHIALKVFCTLVHNDTKSISSSITFYTRKST